MPQTSMYKYRHRLHQLAELSGKESKTAAYVAEVLGSFHPDVLWTNVGGHGVVAIFKGEKAGHHILLRAELDALPIAASNTLPYRSENAMVSHRCGHDGHMAILLEVGEWLSGRQLKRGQVVLLFQPAEETGAGAKMVLQDSRFEQLSIDYAFALHNLPGYPLGTYVLKTGPITAAVKSIIIKIQGHTAHAAEPENGRNPAYAIGRILTFSKTIQQEDVQDDDFFLITPVFITLGDRAYGVAAGYGEVHFTLRTWANDVMEKRIAQLLIEVKRVVAEEGLDVAVEWTDEFEANENDKEAVAMAMKGIEEMGGRIAQKQEPLKWGEDFGAISRKFVGAFIGLGAGESTPALHHPDYDFPDQLLEPGASLWKQIIWNSCES